MSENEDKDPLLSTPKSTEEIANPPRVESTHSLLGENLLSVTSPGEPASQGAGPPVTSTPPDDSSGSNKMYRKPPRAPPPLNAPQGLSEKKKHHHQVDSNGDYSFMSALTDDSPEESPVETGPRHRSVSFEQNITLLNPSDSILQPVLSEGSGDLPASIVAKAPHPTNETERSSAPTSHKKNSSKHLTLADLAAFNPLENEAESAILKVLEAEGEDRGDPQGGDEVLPMLSKEAVDAFTAENDSSKPTSDQPSVSGSVQMASDSRRSIRSEKSVKPSVAATETPAPETFRSNNLEDKLHGLTKAMIGLQAIPEDTHNEPESEAVHDTLARPSIGAADALLHNGDVLFGPGSLYRRKSVHNMKTSDSEDNNGSGGDVNPTGASVEVSQGDEELGHVDEGGAYPGSKKVGRFKGGRPIVQGTKNAIHKAKHVIEHDVEDVMDFLKPRKKSFQREMKKLLLFITAPFLAISALLYYAWGNPLYRDDGPTYSWLVLFIVRQSVTLAMAKATQIILIDYLSLRTRWTIRVLGPVLSLWLVQSKGWPFILTFWGLYDLFMLCGSGRFAAHWLFWQDIIGMFNANNLEGTFISDDRYVAALFVGFFTGLIVSWKRYWWGLRSAKRSYLRFGDEVAKLIEQMILLSEISNLGSKLESMESTVVRRMDGTSYFNRYLVNNTGSAEENSQESPTSRGTPTSRGKSFKSRSVEASPKVPGEEHFDEAQKNKFTGTLNRSQKATMIRILGEWEEPEIIKNEKRKVSLKALLQFRQTQTFMDSDYPFSVSFGLVNRREHCVDASQKLYDRLMLNTPDLEELPFETIATLATSEDGTFDQVKMKKLIRLFRPDRNGKLSKIDFVKSCDTVYKTMRLLRASIINAEQIERAFETIVNFVFYLILIVVILAILGYDPLALFLSLSSLILGFAFMIGSASAKYFEGLLFVLIRRPYDIGDRIALSDVNNETSTSGSNTWFVQNIDLFTTTVRFAATNEVASLSNGSLAASRVINGNRSPKAVRYVHMKFSVDIPYKKVQVFKKAVENFVKDRPREWLTMMGFRATRVEQDLGYIEYVIVVQHREAWQNIGPILNSTADLSSFCLELSKKLEMRYAAPPLPVNLAIKSGMEALTQDILKSGDFSDGVASKDDSLMPSPDFHGISDMFRKKAPK